MKTASFGIACLSIVIFTILGVLTITTTHTRTVNLQDNLQRALEKSLETAMDENAYDINTNDELVADVIEGMALYLDDNCDLTIEVNAIDKTLGILSVKATAEYYPINGGKPIDRNDDGVIDAADKKKSKVVAERTVILEQYVNKMPGQNRVSFYVYDTKRNMHSLYKTYTLSEEASMIVPKAPSGFDDDMVWYLYNNPDIEKRTYTRNELKDLSMSRTYVFGTAATLSGADKPNIDINGDGVVNQDDWDMMN